MTRAAKRSVRWRSACAGCRSSIHPRSATSRCTPPIGRHTLVFNGEIYNFLEIADELKAAGHRFESAADTEVVLAAYAEWGPDCVTRFNGIWAFALWDASQQRLVLSRDRFGVKPLFLARRAGALAFASEIKALLALPWVSPEVEPSAVHDFLRDGLVDHTDSTFFRDIVRLPAAHNLIIEAGHETLERYWQPPFLSDDVVDPAGRARRRTGRRAARPVDRLRCAATAGRRGARVVPLRWHRQQLHRVDRGRPASRRAASALVRPSRARCRARSWRSSPSFARPGIDERPYVDAVVSATGVTLRTTTPAVSDVLSTMADVIAAQDEPFGSSSIVAQYFVMRLAHEARRQGPPRRAGCRRAAGWLSAVSGDAVGWRDPWR